MYDNGINITASYRKDGTLWFLYFVMRPKENPEDSGDLSMSIKGTIDDDCDDDDGGEDGGDDDDDDNYDDIDQILWHCVQI
ncbi:hypothetical protein LSH36_312g03058 [Paralvinella palmiformis]|uniref:Uncharacterized protein n=1 Tax=Paralvinella palmiformis TaxID=53620 RepID=A0AAD9JHB7_9ANNE|nr:hypothetical protein LSH36_312g03058 [Paralvinella palmiformis]